ncbi:TetR family transcriptional regulator [Streptomyces sp. NPDC001658]
MTDADDILLDDRPSVQVGRDGVRGPLLEAAVRVAARGGLRKLIYRAIAAEAGVTHGLVAHHLGSRDTLLEEARSVDALRRLLAAHRMQASPSATGGTGEALRDNIWA